jgi:competence protein ComEC
MTLSKTVLCFCLSFIGGIFINSFLNIPSFVIGELFILGVFYSLLFFKKKLILVFGLCLIFLSFGILRYQTVLKNFETQEIKDFINFSEQIEFIGQVIGEPDIRQNKINFLINVEKITINKISISMSGRILVTANRYPEYTYGNKLRINGVLKEPCVFEDFNYKNYLRKDNISAVIYYPSISIMENDLSGGEEFYKRILYFKNKLRKVIVQNLSPPQSSILSAIILGDKKNISDEWKDKLNKTGVRHITAVSGMHIVILTSILMSLLIGIGFSRGEAFYFTILFIFLYIMLIGFPSSAVRAGIMAGFLLLAQKIGRISQSQRSIVFAASIMLFQNPFLLRNDVGFQLSFLAVLGISYALPIFQNWLKFIPKNKYLGIKDILCMTFSAQIFTLPILIYNFGYISLVSPLANILIVPILPFIMISGFIFSFIGIFWQFLGWIFSFPAWFLLTYAIKIIDLLHKVPFASLELKIPWFYFGAFYSLLAYFIWKLKKINIQNF